jgi:hypothetical protein
LINCYRLAHTDPSVQESNPMSTNAATVLQRSLNTAIGAVDQLVAAVIIRDHRAWRRLPKRMNSSE